MNSTVRRIFAAALLALPLAAFAAPPFNCQTITQSGSYTLTKNLTSTGDCILIAADFVTIDLAGFTISGSGDPTSIGIRELSPFVFPGLRGVVVRNGNVTNFGVGIELLSSLGATIENVNASANVSSGTVLGNRAVVRSSRFDDNGGNGLTVSFGGTVTGSTATRNANAGFDAALGSIFVNNLALNNRLTGIAQDCPGAAIANAVTDNGPTFDGPNLIQINGSCISEHNSTL
jgi:hypothetical protein